MVKPWQGTGVKSLACFLHKRSRRASGRLHPDSIQYAHYAPVKLILAPSLARPLGLFCQSLGLSCFPQTGLFVMLSQPAFTGVPSVPSGIIGLYSSSILLNLRLAWSAGRPPVAPSPEVW